MDKQKAIESLQRAYADGCAVIDGKEGWPEWLKDLQKIALASACETQARYIEAHTPSEGTSEIIKPNLRRSDQPSGSADNE